MRIIANLFLILFLADGVVSTADSLLPVHAYTEALADIGSISRWVLIIIAALCYACLAIDRRLPKRILLPQLIFVFWSAFEFWPLPVTLEKTAYAMPAALGQLILGALPIAYLGLKYKKPSLIPKEKLARPAFSWKNTSLFVVVNLVLLPAILVFIAMSSLSLYLDRHTAGFARLKPDGLYMMEKVYDLEGKKVRLTSMIHIADIDYYNDVVQSIDSEQAIVLAEGITDRDNLLSRKFSYGRLAQHLGLTSQETVAFRGTMIDPQEMRKASNAIGPDTYHLLKADIDVNRFHPKSIEFLNLIGEEILGSPSFAEGMRNYLSWIRKNAHHFSSNTVMNDILHKRNQHLIRQMEIALGHYDTIIIPWGALHMPAFEAAVLRQGFVLEHTRERVGIDFRRLHYARLLRTLMRKAD